MASTRQAAPLPTAARCDTPAYRSTGFSASGASRNRRFIAAAPSSSRTTSMPTIDAGRSPAAVNTGEATADLRGMSNTPPGSRSPRRGRRADSRRGDRHHALGEPRDVAGDAIEQRGEEQPRGRGRSCDAAALLTASTAQRSSRSSPRGPAAGDTRSRSPCAESLSACAARRTRAAAGPRGRRGRARCGRDGSRPRRARGCPCRSRRSPTTITRSTVSRIRRAVRRTAKSSLGGPLCVVGGEQPVGKVDDRRGEASLQPTIRRPRGSRAARGLPRGRRRAGPRGRRRRTAARSRRRTPPRARIRVDPRGASDGSRSWSAAVLAAATTV